MCLGSVVRIKSSYSIFSKGQRFLNFNTTLSASSRGVKFTFSAELAIFWPCSSVPVEKRTSYPDSFLYLAITSAAIVV